MDWDEYYMRMVYLAASKSKDMRTRIGAVVVDQKHCVISSGFNGFCRGVFDPYDRDNSPNKFQRDIRDFMRRGFEENDHALKLEDTLDERIERPAKYFWFEHAERNSIYTAARNGVKLDGAIMYTNGIPCADCGRAVIQAGLSEVVIHEQWPMNGLSQKLDVNVSWTASLNATKEMFLEAGVNVRVFSGRLGVKGLCDGKEVDV